MPVEPVRLTVIGLQHGRDHLRAIERTPEARLVACCDLKTEWAPEAASRAVPFYTDYRQMLAEVRPEGVILAVPHGVHAPLAEGCAAAGCHALVEKPIAMTLGEADRIIAACRQHGRVLAVGHMRRFSPAVQEARAVLQSGRLGRLLQVLCSEVGYKSEQYFERRPWVRSAAHGGGPLYMNTIHTIDDLRYLLGEVEEVFATVSHAARSGEVEDGAAATLRFRSGVIGTLLIGDAAPSLPTCSFGLYGSEASYDVHQYRLVTLPDRYTEGARPEGVDLRPPGPFEDAKVVQTRRFAQAIRGLGPPSVTGEEGRKTLASLLALKRSAAEGRPVRPAELDS